MKDNSRVVIIVATRNRHKVEEIQSIMGANKFRFLTLDNFPAAPAVEETGTTFVDNATLKAVGLTKWLVSNQAARGELEGKEAFVLADDSGLEVDGLNGAPGVYSARFAGLDTGTPGNSPDHENNAKLLRLLASVPSEKRSARFRCVLALTAVKDTKIAFNEAEAIAATRIFTGACEGRITDVPSGKGGFGYDPLFIPQGYDTSFAELGSEVKNKLSHRAKALQELRKHFCP